ncbi:hypothetical protein FRB94_007973 [Tulasnella sp. JGI-2019a]|nr:hypothetical protein FRB93_007798 [Tulasnella sp. JGI-2019a]KAG8996953.1 hypothetical protein FRB94_007973 [Tulasnella sp. JGI-2019a]
MEIAKQGLKLLSTALKASPIPDPFKSAVTAIPDIALQIIEIVDAVKGNVEDAKTLALYIANVTETAMRPFENKPAGELERSPDTKKRLQEFQGVLEKIEEDMQILIARRLGRRVLSYAADASKLATMKQNVDDAINRLQLEIVVAVGHDVDVMRQDQSCMFEDQRQMNQDQRQMNQDQRQMNQDQRIAIQDQAERDHMAAEQRTQQQLLMIRQPDMTRQERIVSEGWRHSSGAVSDDNYSFRRTIVSLASSVL